MKTVCVCASKRYNKEIKEFCTELKKLGVTVFEPSIDEPIPEESFFHSEHVTNIIFTGLTLQHFGWLRKADACFVYNKDDYAGVSVTLEMGFAYALGKPIYALNKKTGDPCRDSIIDKIATTPEQLTNLLK